MDERTLKARALACLAQREHSRSDLRRKLLKVARAQATPCSDAQTNGTEVVVRVETVLDWLEASSYLSQQRFVESRVRVRGERFGTLRIRQEMAQHGLALPAQSEAELLASEFDRACAIWARKFGRSAVTAFQANQHAQAGHRAKQARFLASRGFSGDVIRRVLRAALSRRDDAASNSDTDDAMARDTRATLPR